MDAPGCHRRLHRYWFPMGRDFGIGVTAFSEAEARSLAEDTRAKYGYKGEVGPVVVDIDVSTLDAKHVLPNIGPPVIRGVWYPQLNL